ncbi:hypothetical protein ALC53_08021 [Atta colombica]|uniref:Uncharacterized protein n=1 Tax=Atta colombica TaxID=520822 RepID=A0A195BBR2_9HYME|nr:hypothetical protein ALC53_08021 [Atta colombica]
MTPNIAGPSPLQRPRIPVTIPCTNPCLSASECMDTNAEIAGYVMLDTEAMIYHVCEPNPYHISCNISNNRPSIIVCLLPSVLIKGPNTICAPTLKMPTTAINIATMRLEKPIANFKAANGSACSHDIGAGGRVFSGKLSGTATNMKNTSKTAIAVANATARFSP